MSGQYFNRKDIEVARIQKEIKHRKQKVREFMKSSKQMVSFVQFIMSQDDTK